EARANRCPVIVAQSPTGILRKAHGAVCLAQGPALQLVIQSAREPPHGRRQPAAVDFLGDDKRMGKVDPRHGGKTLPVGTEEQVLAPDDDIRLVQCYAAEAARTMEILSHVSQPPYQAGIVEGEMRYLEDCCTLNR